MEFVSFEIAKKLKDLGFNEPFFFFYREDDKVKYVHHANINKPLIYCNKVDDEVIIAPTISQVLKWLREEKKIYLELVIVVDGEYMCDIYKIDARPIECLGSTEYSKTYEAAALAGIEYVLDNLI